MVALTARAVMNYDASLRRSMKKLVENLKKWVEDYPENRCVPRHLEYLCKPSLLVSTVRDNSLPVAALLSDRYCRPDQIIFTNIFFFFLVIRVDLLPFSCFSVVQCKEQDKYDS